MTIRYVREGLRVVRASAQSVDGGPAPAPQRWTLELGVQAVEDDLAQAHLLVRAAAANLRKLAREARWRRTHLVPQGDRDGRQRLAAERGVDGPGIARARALVGLSQRDLGRQLSYSRGLVAECEHNRRNPPPRLTEWAAQVLETARATGEA